MGNLSTIGPEAFTKDHHKKGYKELGWAYVRIAIQKGPYCITEPYACEDVYQYGSDADGEYIIWKGDEPIAEFKHLGHAMFFLTLLVEGKIKGELR
jgi:hypothetical protein